MKNTIQWLLGLWLMASVLPAHAQDMEADLKSVQANYQSMKAYHLKMTATIYKWEDLEKPAGTKVTQIKRKGADLICEMDQMLMLMTEEYLITQLKEEAVLVCNKREASAESQNLMPDFDEVLGTYDELLFKGYTKGWKCYVLKNQDSPTPVIEVYLDEKSKLVRQLVYHYKEDIPGLPAKVEIEVAHLALNANFSKKMFSPDQYVQISEDVVQLKPSHKDYTLILGDGLKYE
ncbi:MAG: hypothetical protein AAFP19_15675 [Bacteroidota bacterium]